MTSLKSYGREWRGIGGWEGSNAEGGGLVGADEFGAGVGVAEDFFVFVVLEGHGLGAVLAHAYAVA